MSRAFVKEGDDQWLHEVAPSLYALSVYLTKENNGIHIYEKKNYYSEKEKRELHEMSDGLTYALNDESKWYVIDL